mmetsp:Transcript_60635/g.100687  ORF Transcript_60635/g.100687 Transcript_60635/m.100687 type:complete len:656 (-) Transcript_60635:87-2054(-)
MIFFAILSIVEYQADSNSFGFREGRNAHQAISIVADSFIKFSKINQPTKRSSYRKVSVENYNEAIGPKFTIRGGNIGGFRKIKKQYKKFYYVFSPRFKTSNVKQYTPYTKYLNVDIVGCFDNISHKAILELVPIANKYLFLLQAWLKALIVGPESMSSKKIISLKPFSGVPQGSIIGPLICNIVLDGLEQVLYKVCLENSHYQLNSEQQRFAEQKVGIKRLVTKRETNITCVRYADDILIFGLTSRAILEKIENALVRFLQSRGLELQKSTRNIRVFCPGAPLTYLGFMFYFPDYKRNSIKLNKRRFTKFKYDITSMCNHRYFEYHRSNPFIIIDPAKFAKIKLKVRNFFRRSLAIEPLNIILHKQNSIIRSICNYYSISRGCRIQLNSLEPLFYKQLWKTIKQKFGSKPKIISFIKSSFIQKNRFCHKRAIQLKPSDVKPYSSQSILWVYPSQKFLNLNKYLDREAVDEFNRKKRIGLSLNLSRYDTSFDKQELHDILITHQDSLCPICFEPLSYDAIKELDHEPSIWNLRENIMEKLLKLVENQIGNTNLQMKYETLLNLSKALLHEVIINELASNLYLRSVHTNCHKTIDRELIRQEKRWSLDIKKDLSKDLFTATKKFRHDIKAEIKKYRKLTKNQRKEISLKRNSYRDNN